MSNIYEIKHLRGTQTEKDGSSRVPAEGQLAVVTDEQYSVLGDGATPVSDLRPMGDYRVATSDHTAAYTVSDVGPSIIAVDTSADVATVNLPTLSANIGRRIYVVNINASNAITIAAEGSDVIGSAGDASIDVPQTVTTTILIGTAGYWEQVATGGGGSGGGGMEIGTIYAHGGSAAPIGSLVCDGSAISRTDYADLFAAIGTTWGVGDGSTTFNVPDLRGAFVRGTGSHGSETMADSNPFAGPAVGAFEDDQMQQITGSFRSRAFVDSASGMVSVVNGSPNLRPNDASNNSSDVTLDSANSTAQGGARTGDETRPFAAGVLYCIKATPATNSGTPLPTYSYSTGWVANSDWTDAEFTVTHGLNAPLSDLIVKFFISTDGTEANAFEVASTSQFWQNSAALSQNAGLQFRAIGANAVEIQTGADGINYVTASGLTNTIDTEAWYYKVKVYRPEVLASELEVTKYDTGWVDISGAVEGADATITHNLGAPFEEVIIDILFEDDNGVFRLSQYSFDRASGANTDYSVSFFPIDNNSIKLTIGPDGIIHSLDNATNSAVLMDDTDTTAKYRVVVYAPKMLENVTPAPVKAVSTDYTITGRTDSPIINVTTGGTDRTITLPAGTSMIAGDTIEVHKVDSGTGKVTVSRAGSDTIDGVTDIDIDSQYDYAKLRWSGSYWALVEYKDHGSGSTNNWERYADGTMRQWKSEVIVNPNALGITLDKPYASGSVPSVTITCNTDRRLANIVASTLSNTVFSIKTQRSDTGATDTSTEVNWVATGRWRA